MYLSTIIVCLHAGDKLRITLPLNRPHLDDVMVITPIQDEETQQICRTHGVPYCTIQTVGKASSEIRKEALLAGLKVVNRKDWLLILDASVVLPRGFRDELGSLSPSPENIYTTHLRICEAYDAWVNAETWDGFEQISLEAMKHINVLTLLHSNRQQLSKNNLKKVLPFSVVVLGQPEEDTADLKARRKSRFEQPDLAINKKELCFVGMPFSGQYAVMDWMMSQTMGHTCFFNNIPVEGNPFESPHLHEVELTQFKPSHYDYHLESALPTKRDFVLYNYVAVDPQHVPASVEQHIGRSQEKYTVVVLRDSFNSLADIISSPLGDHLEQEEHFEHFIQLWIAHAKEYAGETNYLDNKVPINFQSWSGNAKYREKIAKQLGLGFTDEIFSTSLILEELAYTRASSGAVDLPLTISPRELTSKWKKVSKHPLFLKLLQWDEAIALNHSLFPRITEAVLEAVQKTSQGVV